MREGHGAEEVAGGDTMTDVLREYRVLGSSQAAAFGPTKNREVAVKLLDGRRERYGDAHPWGPWRLEERVIGPWRSVTGTLWEA
jgi:hypothetical protein